MENQQTKTIEKKKQAVSISYMLQSFGANIVKLKNAKLIDDKEEAQLMQIKERAVRAYMKEKFGM